MSASLLVLGIVLAGIGLVLFLILSIIALSNGNKRNSIMFPTFFLVCLITLLLSISELTSKVSNKIRNEFRSSIQKTGEIWEEAKAAEEQERADYLEWLKTIAPEEYRDSLSFFDTFDMEKNVYCIPMVYPYRLEMDGVFDKHARLAAVSGEKPKDIYDLVAITKLTFDSRMMLARRDINGYTGRMPSGLPEISYVILEFNTGKTHTFLNQQALIDEAVKMGFTGSIELEDIRTYYDKL